MTRSLPRLPVPTRLSPAALAELRKRSDRARLGPSAYASRLLEQALLGDMRLSESGEEHSSELDPKLLFSELFFVSAALEKFLEKQEGLVPRLRSEAEGRAHNVLQGRTREEAATAPSKVTEGQGGTGVDLSSPPSREPEAVKAAALSRLLNRSGESPAGREGG